ncbi:RNA polymerase sigma factor [Aeoliella sp. ICT_H6.2]|uniref:RNA polymerase sigma factor n=1 Tax=Aeoliella straminimaris TaxID=2954799 RepID=A0A9X2JFX6_9BACT|nr:sigma-70 family RNA polymerase sigma factor [Aeoliella straminimaris]MCO6042883.1 RNA polymerase sigma factor [Aeoliella straminimaris]
MTHDSSRNPALLEAFRPLLLMLVRAQLGPKYRARIDPEDIVNQTLFDAHRHHLQLRGSSEEELVAWLRKVLDSDVKDAIRHMHREKRDVDRECSPVATSWRTAYDRFLDVTCTWTSPSMNLIRHEREMQLATALAELPDAQREAVELHHLHECSLAETADHLGRTVQSVVGLLRRGLKRLRELLQEPTTGYQ